MIFGNKRGCNLGGVYFTATQLHCLDPQMGRGQTLHSPLLYILTRMEVAGKKMKTFSKLFIFAWCVCEHMSMPCIPQHVSVCTSVRQCECVDIYFWTLSLSLYRYPSGNIACVEVSLSMYYLFQFKASYLQWHCVILRFRQSPPFLLISPSLLHTIHHGRLSDWILEWHYIHTCQHTLTHTWLYMHPVAHTHTHTPVTEQVRSQTHTYKMDNFKVFCLFACSLHSCKCQQRRECNVHPPHQGIRRVQLFQS